MIAGHGVTGAGLPLRDVRVPHLGQYVSGLCAAVLLAEMGADVVKVQPAAGDLFRTWESGRLSATFVAFNRVSRWAAAGSPARC